MSRSNIDKIINLRKDPPDSTRPEEMDQIMYRLYAKKEDSRRIGR